jgi:hypothetical protein
VSKWTITCQVVNQPLSTEAFFGETSQWQKTGKSRSSSKSRFFWSGIWNGPPFPDW